LHCEWNEVGLFVNNLYKKWKVTSSPVGGVEIIFTVLDAFSIVSYNTM